MPARFPFHPHTRPMRITLILEGIALNTGNPFIHG